MNDPSKHRDEHQFDHPISNGPNARPRDEPIGQSGGGLPDDSSRPVEIDPDEERRIEASIRRVKPQA